MLRNLVQIVFINVLLSFLYVPALLISEDIFSDPSKLIVLISSVVFFNIGIIASIVRGDL